MLKGGDLMNTIAIVRELADERSLTFFKLSQICDVSHSTLKNSERRGGQLSVDTIERICDGLGIICEEGRMILFLTLMELHAAKSGSEEFHA